MTNPGNAVGNNKIAVVTGASSGIGAATARALARDGYSVVLGARRTDRVETLAEEIGGRAMYLDVTDAASVERFVATLDTVHVLVNNAGGAKGLAPVSEANLEDWRWMWETNVVGTLRITKALLPALIASGDGLIVTVTSIAALDTLRLANKTVGVISHVELLKERIPVQIRVEKLPGGQSRLLLPTEVS